MKLEKLAGATSEIWQIFVQNSASTVGAGLTGLVFNTASLTAYYHRDTDGAATVINLVTMAVGTFTSSGFKEIDATNMPGWYQFCPPNAALAAGAKSCGFHLKGAANMADLPIEVQLTAVDLDNATSMGLSRLDATISSRSTLTASNVWQDATAGDFTVASSIGKALFTGNFVPGANGGLFIAGSNAGTTTIGALTITGATTHTGNVVLSDGLTISAPSTGNRAGLSITGNGNGDGVIIVGGSTGGHGINTTGAQTKDGIHTVGGNAFSTTPAGHGINALGGTATTNVGGVAGTGLNALGGSGAPSGNGAGAGLTTTGGGTVTVAGNAGMIVLGTGNASGATFDSGSVGVTGDGITATSHATSGNGAGLGATGAGSGPGLAGRAGATGHGLHAVGGATSGNGFTATGSGGASAGISVTAGPTGVGLSIAGGGTSGDGVKVTTVSGHGVNLAPVGTNMHGFFSTGGNGGVSDGMKLVAGTGGVDLRANITGNITGTLATVTTLTNLPAITANWLTAAGINAGALNGKGDWLLAASYTAPLNLSAAATATAVWTDAVAGDFTVAASVGKSIMNGVALGTGLTVNDITTKTGYSLSATGLNAVLVSDLAAVPASNATFPDALSLLYMSVRNARITDSTAATDTIGNNAGAVIATATVTDTGGAGGAFTKTKYV